jgi:hypothetical protein
MRMLAAALASALAMAGRPAALEASGRDTTGRHTASRDCPQDPEPPACGSLDQAIVRAKWRTLEAYSHLLEALSSGNRDAALEAYRRFSARYGYQQVLEQRGASRPWCVSVNGLVSAVPEPGQYVTDRKLDLLPPRPQPLFGAVLTFTDVWTGQSRRVQTVRPQAATRQDQDGAGAGAGAGDAQPSGDRRDRRIDPRPRPMNYWLHDLVPGLYRVRVEAAGYLPWVSPRPLFVPASGRPVRYDFVLMPDGSPLRAGPGAGRTVARPAPVENPLASFE